MVRKASILSNMRKKRDMKKIYNVCYVGSMGLADYSVSLSNALCAHATSVLITANNFSYPSLKVGFEIKRIFGRSRRYVLDMVRFLMLCYRDRPDVVVFQNRLKVELVELFIVKLLRLMGIRTAITVHDIIPHYPKFWHKFTHSLFYNSFDKVVVHSYKSVVDLKNIGVVIEPLVVPHGVYDLYKLTGITRDEARKLFPKIGEESFVVLFFGKVDERKGGEVVLDLIDSCSCDDLLCLVAGANGMSTSRARMKLDEIEYNKRCEAHIHRIAFEDVEKYFKAADVVVMPYLEGTTSGVLKLAMAFELPVIATNVGDFSEALQDEIGILIDRDRLNADLCDAIKKIKKNPSYYSSKYEAIGNKYDWDVISKKYYDYLMK